MDTKLTKTEVEHLARLARLGLKDQEIAMFQQQLAEVIDYNVSLLSEVDISNVPPTAQTTGLTNVWQEDQPKASLAQSLVLGQAPHATDTQFVVPAVKGES